MPIEEEVSGKYRRKLDRERRERHAPVLAQQVADQEKAYQEALARFPADQRLLARGDGWLRVCPADGGRTVFLKFKYTLGRWAGFYHMVRIELENLAEGYDILLRKVEESDTGSKKPTRDTPYDG